MWDEYTITKSEITGIELGETKDLNLFRSAGTAIDNLYKGVFTVDGKNGCRLFMNPEAGKYIKITTGDRTYYISGSSAEETEALYSDLAAQ